MKTEDLQAFILFMFQYEKILFLIIDLQTNTC